MDEELPQPKISTVEMLLIGFVFVVFDTIGIILVLFALDDFWIIDILTSVIFFYLLIKGVPPMRQLIAWLLELVPWLGALPLLTIGWIATVWLDRHPESGAAKLATAGAAVAGRYGGKVPVSGAGTKQLSKMAQNEERAERWAGRAGGDREGRSLPPPYDASGKPATGGSAAGKPSETRSPTGSQDQSGASLGGHGTGTGQPGATQKEDASLRKLLGEPETPHEELGRKLFPQDLDAVSRPRGSVRVDDKKNVIDLHGG
jgi:hypothetical protein